MRSDPRTAGAKERHEMVDAQAVERFVKAYTAKLDAGQKPTMTLEEAAKAYATKLDANPRAFLAETCVSAVKARLTERARRAPRGEVTRIEMGEEVDVELMEPLLDGTYAEATVKGHAWKCNECGRVWDRRWVASQCAGRGHSDTITFGPYGVRYVENGLPVGELKYYTHSCLRREKAS
jgi:hypothetical protein